MNPTGNSHFNQARIEWAIRLRYSPLPDLNMDILGSQLNAFRIGELRVIGKTWEVMHERDAELAVNSDKRKADAAGLDWQIVSDGSLAGDRHAAALQYFYDHLTATMALDQDSIGGTDELIYQVLSALDYYYSAHEMLLRIDNAAAREVTCEFRHTPIWFLEARRGYLGYLQHIFDLYGQPCLNGEWLTAVNQGWMRPLTLVFALKAFALGDWARFNARYGSGFLDAQTTAQQGTPEWDQALKALQELSSDGAVLHNESTVFKFLEQSARNALPFEPMVQWCNSLYAKCYRGVDLATSSRNGQSGAQNQPGGKPLGASIQKEEYGIFLVRDAKWVSGVFNERIDRPVLRYLFGQEPRAWFALMPPLNDYRVEDLQALQTLVPMGLRVALKDVYQRFHWKAPEGDDPCLTPPVAAPAPEDGGQKPEDGNGENSNSKDQNPRKSQNSKSKPDTADVPASPAADGETLPAQTTDADPIAPGADPGRWAQTGDPALPDPQVDAAAFWSRMVLMPKGADGQTLPLPSLGYALPNEKALGARLQALGEVGLGNSRAAQGLRQEMIKIQNPKFNLALPDAPRRSMASMGIEGGPHASAAQTSSTRTA
jgi:hypothetical protein